MRLPSLLLIALCASGCARNADRDDARSSAPSVLAIRGVTVVDVEHGALHADRTVRVREGHIVSVDSGAGALDGDAPDSLAMVVDGSGKYLIPGLWDMHVHTTDRAALGRFVAYGVLGVRDMGGGAPEATDGCESLRLDSLLAWRARVAAGEWRGPRMVLAGPAASGTGWPTSLTVHTPEDARSAVAALRARGSDFVKVYEAIPLPAFRALGTAARAAGLPMAGHVPGESVSLREAVHAGQRSVEHVRDALLVCHAADSAELTRFMTADGWSPPDIAWGRRAYADCADVLSAARARSVWLTPTLSVERAKVAAEDDAFVADPRRRTLPPSVRTAFEAFVRNKRQQPPDKRASEHLWWRAQQRLVRRARDAGAALLAGTDAACEGGLHGASLHEELSLLVESGLTPSEALRAATLAPAEYLRATDSLGAVAPGMAADLVLLDSNPLADIRHTTRIRGVVLAGRWMDRAALDGLLDDPRQGVGPAP